MDGPKKYNNGHIVVNNILIFAYTHDNLIYTQFKIPYNNLTQ